jgi:NAD(P)-dependent dehydrogenase (short-subunit alcohol dehydrogenase family)
LYDGGRAREVLIIDPTYHKLFYNKGEPPAESEPEAAPLPAGQMQTQPPVPAPSPAAAQRAAQVAEPALTERHVLRLVEAPPAHSAEPGRIAGTTLIVGENAAAIALESRLVAAGSRVLRIGTAGTRDEALARLEAAWRESPAETLILASSADDAAEHIFEPGQWRERLEQGVLAPYFLLQRWRQLWLGWEGRSRATVLGLVRLGGDFGLGGNCAAPEGGAIAGMLKSLKIEDLRSQANALRVRVVDVRSDEAPSSVAEYLHRELREAGDEIEVSWLSGRRLALRPLAETAPPGEAEIPRGGVWVVTGGGCGISAATALALGQRYGLKLHLIGRTPLAAPDAAWRHKSPAELEALKAEILRRPAMNGQSPQAAWERMRRQMEIDANLRRFCEAGVAATYHACDVGDREGLSRVLDEIRRTDGPITGILHGAGTNNPARLERQRREVVETMVRAKVGGAWNLMLLTRQDPVRFFLGFGSVTGRFGGNGMTDYAATNDMLARLVGWYRRERPECAAVCFDWESWSDVGMAVAPRHVMAGIQAKLEFMPPREGVEHIVRELAAGAPEAEVVLTREAFIRERYPHVQIARPAELAPLGLPLISAMRRTAEGCIAEALLDPVTDPFLREHRLRNRPLMPAVVGLELLAEAAYAAADQQGEVNALADVQIVDGLSFPTDQPQQPRVTAVRAGQGRYAARVTCDFFNRQGKLIQAERPYLQGQVELAARRERLEASCPPPRGRWHAFHYEDGHVMYHGSALRGVQQTTFDEREGWARLVALPLQGLAGRRPAGGWIVPSTLLDAAFYACGIHVWYHAGGAVSLPRAIDRLRLGRPLRSHEQCLVHFVCRELSGQAAAYDFTISGEDGEPIAQVAGYRKVLLTDRRAGT